MANPRNLVDIAPLVSASNTGNLGIGTTSPISKLHVNGDIRTDGDIDLVGNAGTPEIRLYQNSGNWAIQNSTGNLLFYDMDATATRVTIDGSGNLGIGTSSPAYKLDVSGVVGVSGGSVRISGTANPYTSLNDGTNTSYVQVASGALNLNVGGANPITFTTNSTLRATLDASGNLGIGTSPSGRFDVSLPGLARLIIGSGGNTSENYYTADVQIWKRANNTEMLRLNSSGQLLINSTAIVSPTLGLIQLLQVAGGAITAGSSSSTDGAAILYGYYGDGATAVFGSEYSSGGPVISYGMEPRNAVGGFKSTYGLGGALNRTAITVADSIKFFVSPTTSAAIGNTVPVTQAMTLTVGGNLLLGYTTAVEGYVPFQIDGNSISSTQYVARFANSSANTSYYNVARWLQGAAGSAVGMVGTGGSTVGNPGFQNSFVVGTQTNNPLVFMTSDTEKMRIDSSGNVSIGTSVPYAKLHVNGSAVFGATGNPITDSSPQFSGTHFSFDGPTNACIIQAINPSNAFFSFHTKQSANSPQERMRIGAEGNVSIGTTSETGVASNTAKLLAGIFATVRGSLSVAHSTTTTLVTLPSGEGNYIVSASLVGSSSPTGYNEVSIVCVSQSTSSITTLVNAATLSLSMSGLNLQVNHGQGATQTIEYSVMRIM